MDEQETQLIVDNTSENQVEEQLPTGFDKDTYIAVTSMIQRQSLALDELKEKEKEFRERLKNILDNDGQLSQFEQQAKESTKNLKKRKKELLESSEAIDVKLRIGELRNERKEIADSLTNNLLSYYQMTGVQTFDTLEGEEREFKLNARLLPIKNTNK